MAQTVVHSGSKHPPRKPPPRGGGGTPAQHGAPPPSHVGGGGGGVLPRGGNIIARAIAYARHQIGTPYVWGGSAPGGFDCSGLVYAAYRAAGYSGIGRTTYSQITQGVPVTQKGLRPGDIVFPSSHHEGLYVGNGMVLEAPHTGDVVKLIPLSSFGFMTARRLVGGGGGVQAPMHIGGQSRSGLPIPYMPGRTPAISTAQILKLTQAQTAITLSAAKQMAKLNLSALKPPDLPQFNPPQQAGQTGGLDVPGAQRLADTRGLLENIRSSAWKQAGL